MTSPKRIRFTFETLEAKQLLAADLVADLNTATAGLNPSSTIVVGDLLFFTADDGIHGKELWRSNGTDDGTFMVRDIAAGSSGSGIRFSAQWARDDPRTFMAAGLNGDLVFFARDLDGVGLWRSDGTSDGTQRVKLFEDAFTTNVVMSASESHIAFRAGASVWLSDGTREGTNVVSTNASREHEYVLIGDDVVELEHAKRVVRSEDGVYYTRDLRTASDHESLWFTDGSSHTKLFGSGRQRFEDLEHQGGLTYFVIRGSGSSGGVLWITDGTEEGTEQLSSGRFGFDPLHPFRNDEILFDRSGNLRRTSGEGDTLVAFGVVPITLQPTANLDGVLYFAHDELKRDEWLHLSDEDIERQLWSTDGSLTGTSRVSDLSLPEGRQDAFVAWNGQLIFANGPESDRELWALTPGSEPEVFFDYQRGGDSYPHRITDVNDQEVVFATQPLGSDLQIWQSNGEETNLLVTIPKPKLPVPTRCLFHTAEPICLEGEFYPISFFHVGEFVTHEGQTYFPIGYRYYSHSSSGSTTAHDRYDLWRTDGTAEGTIEVTPDARTETAFDFDEPFSLGTIQIVDTEPVVVPGQVYWSADQVELNTEIPRAFDEFSDSTSVGSRTFFAEEIDATNPSLGLWVSDDAAGRTLLATLPPEDDETLSHASMFTSHEDTVYFVVNGRHLWRSDGTTDGTYALTRSMREVTDIATTNDFVYFAADDTTHGSEIWRTDGTIEGTELEADRVSGVAGSNPSDLAGAGRTLFFAAVDGVFGRELWRIEDETTEPRTAADINSDGFVNFADFLVLSSIFGEKTEKGISAGDLDGSGRVDFADFLLLSDAFGN